MYIDWIVFGALMSWNLGNPALNCPTNTDDMLSFTATDGAVLDTQIVSTYDTRVVLTTADPAAAVGEVTNLHFVSATQTSITVAWDATFPVRIHVWGSDGMRGQAYKAVYGDTDTWYIAASEWEIFGTYAWPLSRGTCYDIAAGADSNITQQTLNACTLDAVITPEITVSDIGGVSP